MMIMMRMTMVLMLVGLVVCDEQLRDNPFQGEVVNYLDGEGRWAAYTANGEFRLEKSKVRVPGDLISDLERAKLIGDPLFELNFLVNNTLWNDYQWNYETNFTVSSSKESHSLVFDGVKMGASVYVNDVLLGNVTDQFLRYVFPLDSSILDDLNRLVVTFDSSIVCDGRWMACTGGWDWAPYSQTSQENAATFTKGIWKSVYVSSTNTVSISHLVPHVFYRGSYPIERMKDGEHDGFDVQVRVHVDVPKALDAGEEINITISGSWNDKSTVLTVHESGIYNATLFADAKDIELWWPNGLGDHPLYEVKATTSSGISTSRHVGFRHFAIVTGNETDPSYVSNSTNQSGTSDFGMHFRVNGVSVFSRGANMIPMEELEGRSLAEAHRRLVYSASDAGFNTFRIWGGGIFLPNAFYDACDEKGIMLYHDMMFAQLGHSPQKSETQKREFKHQARRLSHHASIVIWDGCNECVVSNTGPTSLYANFVLTTIAEEDKSRSVWPACPSAGWSSGVDRLTSRPDGTILLTKYDTTMETHGPYQHGNGWSVAANDGDFDATRNGIPTYISESNTGLSYPSVFGSEFGCVVMSSFESMSPLLKPEHWGLHGGEPDKRCKAPGPCDGTNAMAERNYDCDPIIRRYFGEEAASIASLNSTGEAVFKKQLYQCMLGQALEIKSDIEARRSLNTYGIIVWQYNEIWPTGGWGSIEYGTPREGQVIGGRWKPLQYFYANHLYRDVICVCNSTHCFLKNDAPEAFRNVSLSIRAVNLITSTSSSIYHDDNLSLEQGPGFKRIFPIDTSTMDLSRDVMLIEIQDENGGVLSHHINTLALPQNMTGIPIPKNLTATAAREGDNLYVDVVSDTTALYVTLTTLAHGRFEDQSFLLVAGEKKRVQFYPFRDDQFDLLQSSIRVENLAGALFK